MNLDIKVTFYFPNALRFETVPPTDWVNLNQKLDKMSEQLDTLIAEVARNTTVEQSAIVLIQGLKAQLDAAGTNPVKLKALSDSLAKNDDDLAAAVAANTPAT